MQLTSVSGVFGDKSEIRDLIYLMQLPMEIDKGRQSIRN